MTVQTKVYNYTGAQQSFTVPPDVLQVRFELWGAAGGTEHGYGVTTNFKDTYVNTSAASGNLAKGNGPSNGAGYVAGTLAVTPGQVFYLYVGGNGYSADPDDSGQPSGLVTRRGGPGGWNGGGKGGTSIYNQTVNTESAEAAGGGGGGGATDIRLGGTALSNRYLVAGGSGGVGGNYRDVYGYYSTGADITITGNPGTPNPPYGTGTLATYYVSAGWGHGGWGGTASASNGGYGTSFSGGSASGSNGKGATTTAGGAGGSATGSAGIAGASGTLGTGGAGASNTQSASNQAACMSGGGGGGGYYGGGGGAVTYGMYGAGGYSGVGAGGGGGSNYINPAFTSSVDLGHVYPPAAAGATGNGGFIRITYTQPPDPPTISSPANLSSVAVDQPVTVAWTFSSPDAAATATAVDIEWKTAAGSTWTLTHLSSGKTGSYTYPANFFTAGVSYDIQVRAYDNNNDVSAWSQVVINVVNTPPAPTITAPTAGQNETTNVFSVSWTNPSGSPELLYEVSIADERGFTVYDTGIVNAATRLNLVATPGFENGVTNWNIVGGSIAQSTTYKMFGTYSGKITWAASTSAMAYVAVPTQPGMQYNASVYVAVGTYGSDPNVTIAAQNPTDASSFTQGATSAVSVAGGFYRISVSFTAQQSTTWITLTPGTGITTAGWVTYLDGALVEINATGSPLPYFDGSNANGQPGTPSWQATVGNSFSQLVAADVLTKSVTWPAASEPVTVYVRYATLASQGIFSATNQQSFTINVAPPGVPNVTLTTDNVAGTVTLDIAAVDTPSATTYFDVFRTDVTHGEDEIRIATNLVPSPTTRHATYVDHTAGTNTTYAYRVRAYSSGFGFADRT